jgi:hypothetical protein
MTPQYTRGTARAITALGWWFASMALTAAVVCSVFFGLHLIGGYLVLGAVTLTLLNLALRTYGGPRWFILVTAAIGGACSVIANTEATGSTVGNGLFHGLSLVVWAVGFLAALGASRSGGVR